MFVPAENIQIEQKDS